MKDIKRNGKTEMRLIFTDGQDTLQQICIKETVMDRYVFKYDVLPVRIEALTLEMQEKGYKLLQVVPYSVEKPQLYAKESIKVYEKKSFYSYTVIYEKVDEADIFIDKVIQEEKEAQESISGKTLQEALTQANKELRRFISKK